MTEHPLRERLTAVLATHHDCACEGRLDKACGPKPPSVTGQVKSQQEQP